MMWDPRVVRDKPEGSKRQAPPIPFNPCLEIPAETLTKTAVGQG